MGTSSRTASYTGDGVEMSRVKLEDKVTETKVIKVVVRDELYALKCDGCGTVFHMAQFCNDVGLSNLQGTFDACAVHPETRKSMGNTFLANVCSFKCAHEVFQNGGWKNIPEYKPYADQDIPLVRGSLTITTFVSGEDEIRRHWDAKNSHRG